MGRAKAVLPAHRTRVCLVGAGLAVALAACQQPATSHCAGGLLCAVGTVCDETHNQCVLADQLTSCAGVATGSFCSYPGVAAGTCVEQVCLPRQCGDGRRDPGEACDDGNRTSKDGCAADCRSDEQCGNNYVDSEVGETCDDGNLDADDGCGSTCRVESCGNNHLDPGEVCDDGNTLSGDGCGAGCRSDERCGNGITDGLAGEQCDDGNLASHDGCSSGCTGELLVWTEHWSPWHSRAQSASTYDSASERLVLFGGRSFPDITNDTWTQVGTTWHQLASTEVPSRRREHAIAFDSVRNQTVLFGGSSGWTGYLPLEDTWSLDSAAGLWIQQQPVESPSARFRHAMVFDELRGTVLLFGGAEGSGQVLDDTWEYDGSSWHRLESATNPPARADAALVYDPARGRAVLFGGTAVDGSSLWDTWEFDSGTATWIDRTGDLFPPSRHDHAMSYDTAHGAVFLFGGIGWDNSSMDDTWRYDGVAGQWTELWPTTHPSPREAHTMTYDRGASHTVMVGGQTLIWDLLGPIAVEEYNDVWYFDGTDWKQAPPFWPESRIAGAMTYVSTHGRVMMYGGYRAFEPVAADTWEFDGQRWWHLASAENSPPSRGAHGMTYDQNADRVVVFGGREKLWGSTCLNETWLFHNDLWSQLPIASSPPARCNAPLVYDSGGDRLVMFGGDQGVSTPVTDDTWVLQGEMWSRLYSAPGPAKRAGQLMVYDEARRRVVLVGGREENDAFVNSDAWELSDDIWMQRAELAIPVTGSTGVYAAPLGGMTLAGGAIGDGLLVDTMSFIDSQWRPQQIAGRVPSGRMWPAIAWNPSRRELVMFGGWHFGEDFGLADTWTLRYTSDWPDEQCTNATDDDHDGLVSCADPDCEQDPRCD